ncbi:MAG: DUF2442 domain-containing protein [Fibrobacterota bacterium]
MLLQIVEANYLGNCRFGISFNDGKFGTADFKKLSLEEPKEVFSRFKDEAFVSQGRLEHGTLLWPGDIDLAPEYIYYTTFSNQPEFHDTFVKWGYCS